MAVGIMNGKQSASRASAYKAAPPSKAVVERASSILPEVDRRLRVAYGEIPKGSTPLGNKRNPVDELIYIQLSVRTRESAYLNTYRTLRRLVGGTWEHLLYLPDQKLLPILASGGMASVKLERLRRQLAKLKERFGRVTLAPLRIMSDEEAEAILRELPGVGPKVARCVLLYSLDRDVFPVDSNCHRVLDRLGFLPIGMHAKAAQDFLQTLVPRPVRRSLHVNLIRLGRDQCLPNAPRCVNCPLLSVCPTGQQLVNGKRSR